MAACLFGLALAPGACSSVGEGGTHSLPLPPVENATKFAPGVVTAGTPEPRELEAAAALGYRSLISLQPLDEPGATEAFEAAHSLGFEVVHIPIRGEDDLTAARAERLAQALARVEHPVIVHCSSANRVGALIALQAHFGAGEPVERALELGRRAGLTTLEPAVRERLERD